MENGKIPELTVDSSKIPAWVTVFYGPPGTLKTTYSFTYPGRVEVFDFDKGAHRGWNFPGLVESGQILHNFVKVPHRSMEDKFETLTGFRESWSKFLQDFFKACENKTNGSLSLDTGTYVWALDRDAYLQEVQVAKPSRKQLLQIEYAEPNARMNMFFDMTRGYRKHLIINHHESDERIPMLTQGGQPILDDDGNQKMLITGKKRPDGFKATRGLADWVFYTTVEEEPFKDKDGKTVEGQVIQVPYITIEKSALGIDLKGMKIKWFSFNKLINILHAMQRI